MFYICIHLKDNKTAHLCNVDCCSRNTKPNTQTTDCTTWN